MINRNISDIFFDLDHTLWDFDRNSMLAFARVFRRFEIAVDIQNFIKIYEPINFAYWKLFREERVKKQELRRGRLIDAFRSLGREYPIEKIDELAEAYIEELPRDNHLFDGAVELLQHLSPQYNLHIITNGFHDVQLLKLKKSEIDHFFNTVTTSEEVGFKKPNPLVFETALKKADVVAPKSLMIGDTFEADILGAEAVGMQTMFFNYRRDPVPGNYLSVNDLRQIKSMIPT